MWCWKKRLLAVTERNHTYGFVFVVRSIETRRKKLQDLNATLLGNGGRKAKKAGIFEA